MHEEDNLRCAQVTVRGRVQGVFFRASTRQLAQSLGLCGYVRNLPDGCVEAVFEGPPSRVEQAVAWCRKGPPGAEVASVQVSRREATGRYAGFSVRF